MLNGIMERKGIRGKKDLDEFIWLNTHDPKFKKGEIVKVTDRSYRICEQRVVGWTGEVETITSFRGIKDWSYGVRVYYTVNGIQKSTLVHSLEESVEPADKLKVKNFETNSRYTEWKEVTIA